MGVYSRIRQHGDNLTIANVLSVAGGAPRGLQTAGSMLPAVGRLLRNFGKNATGFWVFGFEFLGVLHEMLAVWHDLLGVWQRKLGVWHAMLGVWHAMLGVWLCLSLIHI